MKKTTHIFIASIFVIGICAFTIADKWYLFESKAFAFTIEFPKKPVEKVKTFDSETGELNLNLFEYIPAKDAGDFNLIYIASCIEYPAEIDAGQKEKQKELCHKAIDAAASRVSGKVTKDNPINLNGYEGIDARIEYKEGTKIMNMRLYVVQNKLYSLEITADAKNEGNKSIPKFMNSFKLIK